MGERGPVGAPIEIRQRLGDPGHRLKKGVESAQIGSSIEPVAPPPDLPKEGAQLWEEVLPVLANYGGLRSVDLPALKSMCELWARAEIAAKIVKRQGYMTEGSTGQPVPHPMLKIEQDARLACLRYMDQFGLTWMARSRLGLSEATRNAVLAGLEGQIGANPRG